MKRDLTTTEELPVLPLWGEVLFPNGLISIDVDRFEWRRRLADLDAGPVLLATIRPGCEGDERRTSLYRVGTVAALAPQRMGQHTVEVLAVGLDRARVDAYFGQGENVRALIRPLAAPRKARAHDTRLLQELRVTLRHLGRYDSGTSRLFDEVFAPIDDPWQLVDIVAANLIDTVEEQQQVLELKDPMARLDLVRAHLRRLELIFTRSAWGGASSAFLN